MKTDEANALCDWIMSEKHNAEKIATYQAHAYVSSDSAKDKALYNQYKALSQAYEKVFTEVCKTLHSLEAKITEARCNNDD